MNRESKRISRIASGEKLDYIREAIEKITEQRIIAAVTTMKSHEEVNRLLSMFSLFRRYVVNEKDSLDKTSKDFEKYATPNNKKFSTAYNMLSSIKSSIFSLYQLLNSNSKKPNCKYIYTDNQSISYQFDHSVFGTMSFMPDLFGPFSESQKLLVSEIKSFLDYMDKCLEKCIEVNNSEEATRNNLDKVNMLFERQIAEIYDLLKDCKVKPKSKKTKAQEMLIENYYNPEIVAKYYHKLNPGELAPVSISIKEKSMSDYSFYERKAFDDDIEKMNRFRTIVKHIEEYDDKISAKTLVFVMTYTECRSSQRAFHTCFTNVYKSMGGKKKIIEYGTFNQACTKFNLYEQNGYEDFQNMMDMY